MEIGKFFMNKGKNGIKSQFAGGIPQMNYIKWEPILKRIISLIYFNQAKMSSFNSMLFLLPFLILPICFGQENPVKVDCTHPSFLCPLNTYCIPQLGLCQPTNQQNNQSTSSPTFPPFTPSNQFGIQCGDKTCQNGEICVRSSTTNMGPAVPAAGGGQQPPQQEQQQCVKFNSQPCYQFGRPVFCAPGQFCFYQQENQQLQEAYCVSLEDQQSTNCDNQQQPNEQ